MRSYISKHRQTVTAAGPNSSVDALDNTSQLSYIRTSEGLWGRSALPLSLQPAADDLKDRLRRAGERRRCRHL